MFRTSPCRGNGPHEIMAWALPRRAFTQLVGAAAVTGGLLRAPAAARPVH